MSLGRFKIVPINDLCKGCDNRVLGETNSYAEFFAFDENSRTIPVTNRRLTCEYSNLCKMHFSSFKRCSFHTDEHLGEFIIGADNPYCDVCNYFREQNINNGTDTFDCALKHRCMNFLERMKNKE